MVSMDNLSMLQDPTRLDDPRITELCNTALLSNNLTGIAQLIDFAEQNLAGLIVESSDGWRNLAIIAQLARCQHSPALALAEEIAHAFYDCVETEYDIKMRDMILAEAGGNLDTLHRHLDCPGCEALYVASRGSQLAAKENNLRLLGNCVERMSDFDDGDWENNNPHLNWRIGCALQAMATGQQFDRASICAEARQSGQWARYCRQITEVLGANETAACIQCMRQMHFARTGEKGGELS